MHAKFLNRIASFVLALVISIAGFIPVLAAAPANDNFTDATEISLLPFNSIVDSTDATIEPGEPQNCSPFHNSVWYSFTPTDNALVRADMAGSSFGDSILNIYQDGGSGIGSLSFLQCAFYGNPVTFSVQAGVTYYVQAGSMTSSGELHLNLQEILRPANDDFDNAVTIDALPYSDIRDTTTATSSFDDPANCHNNGSVWYKYTPASDTTIIANTVGSSYDTTLGVFTGTRGALNLVPGACNDDFYGLQSRVAFTAIGGTTYYFMAGFCCGNGGTGGGNLVFSVEEVLAPPNDNFANATTVSSLPTTIDFDTTGATFESNEPSGCGYPSPPYKTIWFTFTASQNGSISASIPSYTFAPFLGIYTGASINNLTQLVCGQYSNKVTFHAVQGQTYYLQVGGYYGQGGNGQFLLEVAPPPQAGFYYYPGDPSKYDNIQFCSSSNDPANVGIQSFTWDFGDGATATTGCSSHRYAADGNYTVQHTVTTIDGRTGTATPQVVQVRTHDVAITKITTPASASVGQAKTITVTLRNTAYPETVQIDLYKSTANGFVWVATVTKSVPVLAGNRTTAVNFNYTFTSDDASLGKVTFKAVATLVGARDAYPSDNEAISSITRIAR